jgi:hypothetical protein
MSNVPRAGSDELDCEYERLLSLLSGLPYGAVVGGVDTEESQCASGMHAEARALSLDRRLAGGIEYLSPVVRCPETVPCPESGPATLGDSNGL